MIKRNTTILFTAVFFLALLHCSPLPFPAILLPDLILFFIFIILGKSPPKSLVVVLGGRGNEGIPYKISVIKNGDGNGISVGIELLNVPGEKEKKKKMKKKKKNMSHLPSTKNRM